MKPYYEQDGIVIYHGDSRDVLPLIADRVDVLISDPPYGINYQRKSAGGSNPPGRRGAHHTVLCRNTAPIYGDANEFDPEPFLKFNEVILWGASHYAQRLPHGRWLIWDKLNGLQSFDTFSDVEIAWFNKRGAERIFRHMWKGICQDSEKDAKRTHPTQKPVALMSWCIGFTKGETILDPFMGSGTTGVAAIRNQRKFIEIEISQAYCDIAVKRIQRELAQPKLFRAEQPKFQADLEFAA